MKYLTILILLISNIVYSQNTKDTLSCLDSVSFYSRYQYGLNALDAYQYSIECGISIPSTDIGIVIGKITDTTNFCLIRFNMMSGNYGRMHNEFSFGLGKTNNVITKNIIDMNSSLMYNWGRIQTGVVGGYYTLFGKNSTLTTTYIQFFARLGFYNTNITTNRLYVLRKNQS
jgi:hypothetical protein